MEMNVFTFWQNLDGTNTPPPYISLCIKSIEKYCSYPFKLHVVNYDNLREYLPGIREDLFKIEYDWKNESMFGKKAKSVSVESMEKRVIAIISDYVRIALLEKYGGLWTDADHVFLRSPQEVFDHLQTKDFVASDRGWNGFTISNGFVGSVKNGKIITAWRQMLDKKLDDMRDRDCYVVNRYGIFGEVSVPKIIKQNIDICHIYTDGTVLPMECKKKKFFSKNSSEFDFESEVMSKNPIICGLWNAGLGEDVKSMTEQQLMESDKTVSVLFRRSLLNDAKNKLGFFRLIK